MALVSYDGKEILLVDFRFILFIVVIILDEPFTITTLGILRFFLGALHYFLIIYYVFDANGQKILMACQFKF